MRNKQTKVEDYYNCIKFKDKYIKTVQAIIAQYGMECVGVHIRRTDHTLSIKESTTEKFIAKMKELIEQNEKIKFYLATDDWEEEKRIRNEFGDRIITNTGKMLSRNTEEGMDSAVIDLLCLSKTNYILGSYTSVFSRFAAQYGNKELIIL